MNKENRTLKIIITFIIAIISIAMVMPFIFMVSSSFKRPMDIMQYPIQWIPSYWYPDNYSYILGKDNSILIMYLNSVKITLINVLGATLTSSLAAFGFTKMRFKGRDALFLVMIATLMVPAQVTYVPKFALFSWLKMMNTHYTLILPGLYAVFGTFLMRQFFLQIPDELVESGVVDGAGELRIWWQIIMPLAKPAIATFIITVFTHHWNDYETPLIFLRDKELYTIPLGLVSFSDESGQQYHYIMALTSLSVLPIFAVFLGGQNYFIKGLTAGAVKG